MGRGLYVEVEMYYVVVFDDVVFVFQVLFIGFFGVLFVFELDEVVVGDYFGVDEVFFEVGVDYVGGLWGGGVDVDGLGVDFFYFGGEVGLQVEQVVVGMDYMVQVGFFEIEGFEEYVFFFVVFQFGDFGFDFVVYRYYYCVFFFGDGFYYIQVWVVFEVVFGDVGDVYYWFVGQQVEVVYQVFFFVIEVFQQ